MVCTSFGMLILLLNAFEIFLKTLVLLLVIQTKNVQQQASCKFFTKDHAQFLWTFMNLGN
jgi:hypothetical protein